MAGGATGGSAAVPQALLPAGPGRLLRALHGHRAPGSQPGSRGGAAVAPPVFAGDVPSLQEC